MAFSDYWYDKEFHELPLMFYYADDKELDLSKSCINMVPAGLNGVENIKLCEKPVAIAPDFSGTVSYEWSASCFRPLTYCEMKKAKITYTQHKEFCDTPHTWAGLSPHTNYSNLPPNMHFVTVGRRTFLDLRKSPVAVKRFDLYIGGVKAVLLPTDKKEKAPRVLKRIREQCWQR